ncbi:MAG: multidrug ABC transporter ATP-binding protein [Deltaproteobacteria bacterium RBG_16_48_10]|nr:MAG: multidrug ABC transporter ATP-binding protein [Deltaproteobacteria bacterium RBG_16_48_10]
MASNPFVVEVESLVKRFGSFVAVDQISFQVEAGRIFGFLGPNGSGKSTTIRMLCGILMPTSGRAMVSGFDVIREPERIKERIGYMSQKFSLYDDLTVRENIRFYSGLYRIPREKSAERARWVIDMAGLSEREDSLTRELSGGWKQRLALGCAILHEPPILFLDEPTSGVDPVSRRNFWQLINTLSDKGVTVFVTTHYMEEAEYCDTLALIYRGRIVAQGSPGSLKTEAMPEDVYEIECGEPMGAMEILKEVKGIREIALFGKLLHLMVEKDVAVADEVKRVLESHGIPLKRVFKTTPSLEDVFVALVKEDDRKRLRSEVQKAA